MTSFSSLRFRLVGTVFLAVAPASVLMYFADKYYAAHYGADLPWTEFVVGLLALGAAWFGGERFILRQVRILSKAARQLAAGDLSSRTGLSRERGELGELAHTFDAMAAVARGARQGTRAGRKNAAEPFLPTNRRGGAGPVRDGEQ